MKSLVIALLLCVGLYAQDSKYTFEAKQGAKLRSGDNYRSSILKELDEGDLLKIDPEFYQDGYLKACYGKICGYISDLWIKWNDDFRDFRQAYQNRERNASYEAADKAVEDFRAKEKEYIQRFGQEIYTKLRSGQVWIGITDEMARIAWGDPAKVNTSTGSWGIHEQWVYESGSYLYFENGKLISIQN